MISTLSGKYLQKERESESEGWWGGIRRIEEFQYRNCFHVFCLENQLLSLKLALSPQTTLQQFNSSMIVLLLTINAWKLLVRIDLMATHDSTLEVFFCVVCCRWRSLRLLFGIQTHQFSNVMIDFMIRRLKIWFSFQKHLETLIVFAHLKAFQERFRLEKNLIMIRILSTKLAKDTHNKTLTAFVRALCSTKDFSIPTQWSSGKISRLLDASIHHAESVPFLNWRLNSIADKVHESINSLEACLLWHRRDTRGHMWPLIDAQLSSDMSCSRPAHTFGATASADFPYPFELDAYERESRQILNIFASIMRRFNYWIIN